VAELVDALDSKSCSFGSAGSIPARGTKKNQSEKQSESEVLHSGFFLYSKSHSRSKIYIKNQSSGRHWSIYKTI